LASNTTLSSVAVPYAKAAFEYACQKNQLAEWSAALKALADAASDPTFYALLKNPKVSSVALGDLIIEATKGYFGPEMNNFVCLLAQNHRLIVLPTIFQVFENYRAAYEKMLQINVTSAYPLSKMQEDKLAVALKIRLQRDVKIQFDHNAALLGGAVIRVSDLDLVIDRSVKNMLARLANDLVSV
jgi:F-type H+-transporting ATPase subunit delta